MKTKLTGLFGLVTDDKIHLTSGFFGLVSSLGFRGAPIEEWWRDQVSIYAWLPTLKWPCVKSYPVRSWTNIYAVFKHAKMQIYTGKAIFLSLLKQLNVRHFPNSLSMYRKTTRRYHCGVKFCKVGWVLWHIKLCRLFNTKSIFYKNDQFYFKQFNLASVHSLIVKKISTSSYSF